MMKSQSITFDDESEKLVNEYRRRQEKIPTFQEAVLDLVKKGAKIKTISER